METVRVEVPVGLVKAAGWKAESLPAEAAQALALYRQDKVSLGCAAELCQMPVELATSTKPAGGSTGLACDRRFGLFSTGRPGTDPSAGPPGIPL
jgi:hypothetical protein